MQNINEKSLQADETKKEKSFSKTACLKSGRFPKDIASAVLEDDKRYTEKEAKNKIEKYLKGRVI